MFEVVITSDAPCLFFWGHGIVIEKVMNNNCVQASISGQEVITSGLGVGYNKKYGMSAFEYSANWISYVRNEQKNKFYKLIEHADTEYVFAAEEAAQYAEKNLEKNLNPSLLLIPVDHISNVTSRVVSGIQINNVFFDEIKALYKAEYVISRGVLTTINEQFSVRLPDDEIGSIVLYILNNHESSVDYESVWIVESSQIITELIETVYNRKVDRNSFNYSRFMMHLKYSSSRMLCNEKTKQRDIGDIYEQSLERDILLQRTVHEIERYLCATFKYELILEEKLYLSIRTKVLMN